MSKTERQLLTARKPKRIGVKSILEVSLLKVCEQSGMPVVQFLKNSFTSSSGGRDHERELEWRVPAVVRAQ